MIRPLPPTARLANNLAALLAFASAAITGYWLAGGTALLDTVGGALERLARDRSVGALALAGGVVALKVAAGAFAIHVGRRPSRRLGTVAAVGGALLALYGAVLTFAGALVLTGILSRSSTDEHALRWHTLFWDPWFLVWGLSLATAGLIARRCSSRRSSSRPGSASPATAS